ncbi:MAG TPA: hypothetical protein VFX70_07835 [Mycobacteriales bacterium]|nr:hypothetical protein [Mycobacteriales bacterium]
MSTELEDLLAEGMRRRGAEANPPERLFSDAVRRHRRRRATVRTLAGAGVVTAVAAGTALGFGVTGGTPAHQPAAQSHPTGSTPRLETAGYVTSRATDALDTSDAVVRVTGTVTGGRASGRFWLDTSTGRFLAESLDAHGNRQMAVLMPAGPGTATVVDYSRKAWWTYPTTGRREPRLVPVKGYGVDTPAAIRSELAAGHLVLRGHQRLAGRDTVHLSKDFDKVTTRVRFDLWVDAHTYRPVRTTVGPAGPGEPAVTNDIDWLPRTAANRARIALTPPVGFIKLPAPPTNPAPSGAVG